MNWCEALQTSNGVHKPNLSWVERTVSLQIVFFNVLTEMPGGGYLGQVFSGYVPLASQNPYPIINSIFCG